MMVCFALILFAGTAASKKVLKVDDFVNSPISALRFISLPLRRTASTPRDTRFARLDLDLFTKSSIRMTYCEFIKGWDHWPSQGSSSRAP
jgi:hypothetical protein